jgi:hypothetical protein
VVVVVGRSASPVTTQLTRGGSDGTGTLKFMHAEISASTLNSAEAVIVNHTVGLRRR